MTELFYARNNQFILPGSPDDIAWIPGPVETDSFYRAFYRLLESIEQNGDKRFFVVRDEQQSEYIAVGLNVSKLSKKDLTKIKLAEDKWVITATQQAQL